MGWQLTTTVVQGQRYRFVVQQPTSGKWSGDVQGSLGVDWGLDLVGNNFEIDQSSSGTWVGQGVAARSWIVPLAPQTVNGFTYLAVAAQARDELTRLVHAATSYTFDVRTPPSWTPSQVMTYLQGKGWGNVQVAAATDVVSLLAGMPDKIASTTAFAVTATWTGADKTSIPDSDGTISYGAFSGQALVSTAPAALTTISTSSTSPWLIGLGVVGVLGLGLVFLARSKPAKNPDYPIIECRIVQRPMPYGPWALVTFIRRGSTTQQKIVDHGDDVNVLAEVGRRLVLALAKHEVHSPHPVRLFDQSGECIFAARNAMVAASGSMTPFSSWDVVPCATPNPRSSAKLLSGRRAAKPFDAVFPKAAKNPRGIFIYDPDALDKLAELEGQRWLADDLRMWQQYRSGDTAHAFQFAWWETHKPGVLGPQDLPFWRDYFAGTMNIELGIIYGDGGYARFSVTDAGEIVLSASTTRPEKADRAEQLGFRVRR